LTTRGRVLRLNCDACTRTLWQSRLREQARSRALAYAAGLEQVVDSYDENGAEIIMWGGQCAEPGCGVSFVNVRPDTRKCERHR
jgi:hypothetical protein